MKCARTEELPPFLHVFILARLSDRYFLHTEDMGGSIPSRVTNYSWREVWHLTKVHYLVQSGSIPERSNQFIQFCGYGGMADTADSNSVVERRTGSSPVTRTKPG